MVVLVINIKIVGVARLGVGQMSFFPLDSADERKRVGEAVGGDRVLQAVAREHRHHSGAARRNPAAAPIA